MPVRPKWTRQERATAEFVAQQMGLTVDTVLRRYMTAAREKQAAERGMPVKDWVEASLAADWLLSEVERMHRSGETPEAIAEQVKRPVDDVRKIINGLFPPPIPPRPPAPPRKERGPEAQQRAAALAMQLKVSMRTAWKYYDEANAERIEAEDDLIWTLRCLREQGRTDAEIGAILAVPADQVTATFASIDHMG